jgi:hypothetical protein
LPVCCGQALAGDIFRILTAFSPAFELQPRLPISFRGAWTWTVRSDDWVRVVAQARRTYDHAAPGGAVAPAPYLPKLDRASFGVAGDVATSVPLLASMPCSKMSAENRRQHADACLEFHVLVPLLKKARATVAADWRSSAFGKRIVRIDQHERYSAEIR